MLSCLSVSYVKIITWYKHEHQLKNKKLHIYVFGTRCATKKNPQQLGNRNLAKSIKKLVRNDGKRIPSVQQKLSE